MPTAKPLMQGGTLRGRLVATSLVLTAAASWPARGAAPPVASGLPPGHPDVDPSAEQPAPRIAGMFEAPRDTVEPDTRLPSGTIVVELRDPDGRPLTARPVTLGVLQQSVAKGESRKRLSAQTDETGKARFSDLATDSAIAYRLSVASEGASFGPVPFRLPAQGGMHVVVHVYPVTRDLQQALVVMQGALAAELRDDRVQFEQAFTVYNFGRYAWQPTDVLMALPDGFTALSAQASMSDQGVEPVEGKGARLRGTFGPGQHEVVFRWQLPYAGATSLEATVGLPPRVALMRVIAAASDKTRLLVDGFPDAESRRDMQGQRILMTAKQMRREEPPLERVHLALRDLPGPGYGRAVATSLAALGVTLGLAFACGRRAGPAPADTKKVRARLLRELEELERTRRDGEVGPITYERARRDLIDALARTLTDGDRP